MPLSVEQIRDLEKNGGFVRCPPTKGHPHRSSAQFLGMKTPKIASVQPWNHGHAEPIEVSLLSFHKSKTLEWRQKHAKVSGITRDEAHIYIIAHVEKRQFWATVNGQNRFVPTLLECKEFTEKVNANRALALLRKAPQWSNFWVENDDLQVMNLQEAKRRFPHHVTPAVSQAVQKMASPEARKPIVVATSPTYTTATPSLLFYIHYLAVQIPSNHQFPIDMLRVDQCVADTSEDSERITETLRGLNISNDTWVILKSYSTSKTPSWNVEMWLSYHAQPHIISSNEGRDFWKLAVIESITNRKKDEVM